MAVAFCKNRKAAVFLLCKFTIILFCNQIIVVNLQKILKKVAIKNEIVYDSAKMR